MFRTLSAADSFGERRCAFKVLARSHRLPSVSEWRPISAPSEWLGLCRIADWTQMQFKFMDGKISCKEYEDWKANWPDSLQEGYDFDKEHNRQTNYKEYMEKVKRQDDLKAAQESLAEKRFKTAQKKAEGRKGKKVGPVVFDIFSKAH